MKKILGISGVFIFLVFFIQEFSIAQEASPADSLFYRGVAAYRAGRYQEALQLMEALDQIYSNHPRITGSLLLEGKSLYKLKEYQKAQNAFKKIIEKYPNSHYVDDALYGMGTLAYRKNLYGEAVQWFLEVVEKGEDDRLLRKAAKLSSDILDYRMNDKELNEFLKKVQGERGKAAATLRLAQREIEAQHSQEAKRVIQNFLDTYPSSHYVFQMEQLLSKVEQMGKGTIKLGAVLPMTGPLSEQGKAFRDGMEYAIFQHNTGGEGVKIELVVRDSESRILKAITSAQELCNDREIVAIVGELSSDLTAAIAAVAQEKGVPLLAPTATLDDLTFIGSYIFQLNSTLAIRGEKLAEYAVLGLGLKRFAILAPADDYGKSLRDAFVRTVQQLGGQILVEKWYFDSTTDFGPQFKAIREFGIQKMLDDKRLHVNMRVSTLVDSTEIAVTAFDGIFVPVYGEDLPYVMPQIAFYNLDAKIFGGSYFNDLDVLEKNLPYIDGVIFVSDFYVDPSDYRFYQFRDEYRKKTGKTPEKMELFGYDTASLFLKIAGMKQLERSGVRDQLAKIQNFVGIRGTISLNEERVNPSLQILQYRGGKIIQIK